MSQTVVGQGLDDGIARDDLSQSLGGRVTVVGSHDIGGKYAAQLWQTGDELACHVVCLALQHGERRVANDGIATFPVGRAIRVSTLQGGLQARLRIKAQSGKYLFTEQMVETLHIDAYLIFDGMDVNL